MKEVYFKINGGDVIAKDGSRYEGTHIRAAITYAKGTGYVVMIAPVRIIADGIVICRFVGTQSKLLIASARKSAKRESEASEMLRKNAIAIIGEFFDTSVLIEEVEQKAA